MRKVFRFTEITVAAYVAADILKVVSDNKKQRFLFLALVDKTSGELPVVKGLATDKIVGTRVRITISRSGDDFTIKKIDTEKTPEFTDVDIPPLGIFKTKK